MFGIGFWEWILFLVLAILFWIIPFWKIFKKIGYPPALSLIMLIPILNIAVLWYLAVGNWPIKGNRFFSNQF